MGQLHAKSFASSLCSGTCQLLKQHTVQILFNICFLAHLAPLVGMAEWKSAHHWDMQVVCKSLLFYFIYFLHFLNTQGIDRKTMTINWNWHRQLWTQPNMVCALLHLEQRVHHKQWPIKMHSAQYTEHHRPTGWKIKVYATAQHSLKPFFLSALKIYSIRIYS